MSLIVINEKEKVTMFTLIRSLPVRQLLLEQVPAFTVSFVLAELFYKFHSFTLECMAFLITWYVLDATINFLKDVRKS
jgi:hypothetical protein